MRDGIRKPIRIVPIHIIWSDPFYYRPERLAILLVVVILFLIFTAAGVGLAIRYRAVNVAEASAKATVIAMATKSYSQTLAAQPSLTPTLIFTPTLFTVAVPRDEPSSTPTPVILSPTHTPTNASTSPTGTIWFTCNDDVGFAQICRINPDGTNEQRVIYHQNAASTYPVMASGGGIIYTSNFDKDHAIYYYDIDKRQEIRLTQPGGDHGFPRISPNGQWITFTDKGGSTYNVYRMRNDGSNVEQIFTSGTHAVWSPDSNQLALICMDENQKVQICITNNSGGGVQRITNLSDLKEWVDWSPTRNELVFSVGSREQHSRKIARINTDGSGYQILFSGSDAVDPAFSPDGNWIVFINYLDPNVAGHGEIYIMRRDGSDVRRLTKNDRNDWLPSWGK